MSRVTTAEGVLETIYALAGVTPPAEDEDAIFRGHPLAGRRGAPRRCSTASGRRSSSPPRSFIAGGSA